MNLPNKLTLARIIMIPFFVFFLLTDFVPYSQYIALGIFALASLTDLLDGKIARKYNLITNFGKFMDPIADKLLVASAFIAFVELGLMPSWIVIILIAREFVVSGFRLVASDAGIVLAAGWGGKFKTATQMILCCFLIVNFGEKIFAFYVIEQVLIYLSLALSVFSMIEYIVKNRKVIADR